MKSLRKTLIGTVIATIVVAAGLVSPGVPHVFATGSPNWGPYYRPSLAPYNAVCSATPTDQSTPINTALTDAGASQGGMVLFDPCPSGQSYGLSSAISLPSNVKVDFGGATFSWVGATNGTMMTNKDNGGNDTLIGQHATFDCKNSSGTNAWYFNTWGDSYFENFQINNCNIAVYLSSTVSGRNMVNTEFHKITGTYDNTMFQLRGTGQAPAGGVVTDNRFYDVQCWKCHQGFVNIVQYADNNYFFADWVEFDTAGATAYSLGSGCSSWCGVEGNVFVSSTVEFEGLGGTVITLANGTDSSVWNRLWAPEAYGANHPNMCTHVAPWLGATLLNDLGAWDYTIERQDLCATYTLVKGSSTPGAEQGYAQVTASQGPIGNSLTDLTGLSITITTVPGERIRLTGYVNWYTTSLPVQGVLVIEEGSTLLEQGSSVNSVSGGATNIQVQLVLNPTSGTHTYKLAMETLGGSLYMYAASSAPAWIQAVTT